MLRNPRRQVLLEEQSRRQSGSFVVFPLPLGIYIEDGLKNTNSQIFEKEPLDEGAISLQRHVAQRKVLQGERTRVLETGKQSIEPITYLTGGRLPRAGPGKYVENSSRIGGNFAVRSCEPVVPSRHSGAFEVRIVGRTTIRLSEPFRQLKHAQRPKSARCPAMTFLTVAYT